FQEAVNVLVPLRGFKAIFDFEHSELHHLGGRCERGAVGYGQDFVLDPLPLLRVKCRGLREIYEEEEGERDRSSVEYCHFVPTKQRATKNSHVNHSESTDYNTLNPIACQIRLSINSRRPEHD